MSDPTVSNKMTRERLVEERNSLHRQHQTVLRQINETIDERIKDTLRGQAEGLENDVDKIDRKLRELDQRYFPQSEIKIHVVVVAMTNTQAEELCNSSFESNEDISPNDRRRISNFLNILAEFGGVHPENYGAESIDWIPNALSAAPISKMIEDVCKEAPFYNGICIELKTFSAQDYYDLIADRVRTRRSIDAVEGIVIVDAVSLSHPDIFKIYSNLPIHSTNLAVMVVAPMNYMDHRLNRSIEELICNHEYSKLRFSSSVDPLCEFSVADLHSFNRWLFRFLREEISIMQNPPPRQQNREEFLNRSDPPNSGMATRSLIWTD